MDTIRPIHKANFRYFGGLEDLLVRRYRDGNSTYTFKDSPGIKDPIETMGIPHTEVDVVQVNGLSVDFSYRLQQNDNVSVYPVFAQSTIQKNAIHLAFHPSSTAQFVLDVHLGKLARRLRLLGFDCLYRNDYDDSDIMQLSLETGRIILTRDLGILKHREVKYGYLVRHDQVDNQVDEVLRRFTLNDKIQPFCRCLNCNGLMTAVDKKDIIDRLEPKTILYFEQFHRCDECENIYWQGSHYEKINRWLKRFINSNSL